MTSAIRGGNFVSEWYGQRIFPQVRLSVQAVSGANHGQCPFLGEILATPTPCVKNTNSAGVCTVSSVSNGQRQDWLVCPYRVISSDIVRRGCQLIFGLSEEVAAIPVPLLKHERTRARFTSGIDATGVGYLFFQDKLGGEISLNGTKRSPELSFDVTLVEIRPDADLGYTVSRYGILEIQTMDYHGSYKGAVRNLREGLRMHAESFPSTLQANLERWAGEGMEGPNVANVFKRTFYQMMLKFRMGLVTVPLPRARSWPFRFRFGKAGSPFSARPSWSRKRPASCAYEPSNRIASHR